jgi:hypothetical protein
MADLKQFFEKGVKKLFSDMPNRMSSARSPASSSQGNHYSDLVRLELCQLSSHRWNKMATNVTLMPSNASTTTEA